MRALAIAPPSPTARRLAKQAARQVACDFAAQPVVELEQSKPRWAKNATRKGEFAPEVTQHSRVRTNRAYERWNYRLKGFDV